MLARHKTLTETTFGKTKTTDPPIRRLTYRRSQDDSREFGVFCLGVSQTHHIGKTARICTIHRRKQVFYCVSHRKSPDSFCEVPICPPCQRHVSWGERGSTGAFFDVAPQPRWQLTPKPLRLRNRGIVRFLAAHVRCDCYRSMLF